MHPVIRLVSFAVLTAFLALGDAANIIVAACILGFLHFKLDVHVRHAAWRLLRRMRWLFLSIAVIYLWLTPGAPLIPGVGSFTAWLPTVDGLWLGALRISALALMAAAAGLLLAVTSRDEMLGALRWLLAPLGRLRFPDERFAVRAVLSLEAVTRMQTRVRAALAEAADTAGPTDRIGAIAAALFASVLREAEGADCAPISLPARSSPPLLQWSMPILLAAAMAAAMKFA
jgi:energy-coupling factor transport system permease protein